MKRLILVFLLVSTTLMTQAQLRFGVKSGANVTKMSLNKDVFKVNNRTGFYLGPTAKFTIPVIGLGIEASALYDQRESDVNFGGIIKNYINTSKKPVEKSLVQKQIAFPFHIMYQQGIGDIASWLIFAGPQFGFNISGNEAKEIMEETYGWEWKDSALSVDIGAGIMLLNHIMLSVNYNIACDTAGEFKFSDFTNSLVSSDDDNKFNSWQIGLTVYF